MTLSPKEKRVNKDFLAMSKYLYRRGLTINTANTDQAKGDMDFCIYQMYKGKKK